MGDIHIMYIYTPGEYCDMHVHVHAWCMCCVLCTGTWHECIVIGIGCMHGVCVFCEALCVSIVLCMCVCCVVKSYVHCCSAC